MSDSSIMIPKDEYDTLRIKATFFDEYIETEELNNSEILKIKKALKGPFMTKLEFLKRHSHLV